MRVLVSTVDLRQTPGLAVHDIKCMYTSFYALRNDYPAMSRYMYIARQGRDKILSCDNYD